MSCKMEHDVHHLCRPALLYLVSAQLLAGHSEEFCSRRIGVQSKSPVILCVLALICLFVPARAKADNIPIANADFSQLPTPAPTITSCGSGCWYDVGSIYGWNVSGIAGTAMLDPYYTSLAPGSGTMAFINGGTITQNLGVALLPDSVYTLSVYVGHRIDGTPDGDITTFSFGLDNGTKITSMSDSTADIPVGTFELETYSFTTGDLVGPGNLTVSLGDAGQQADFTDVSLSEVSTPEPSSLVMLAIGLFGLFGLAKRYGFKPAPQAGVAS